MSSTTKEREGGHEVLGDRGRWYQLKQRSRYRDTLILVLFIGTEGIPGPTSTASLI